MERLTARLLPLFSLLFILVFTTQSLAATSEKAWSDPQKAEQEVPDFSIQGEYKVSTRWVKMAAQVVALGDGKFKVVGLNGLPGEVSRLDNKMVLEMGTENGRVGGTSKTVKVIKGDSVPRGSTIWIENDTIKVSAGLMKLNFKKVERKSPTLNAKAPEVAVVLFDGTSADKFEGGKMTDDGLMEVGCRSKQKFKSHKMHLEFRTPFMPKSEVGERGNGGLSVQGLYEIQILDTFGKETTNGASGQIEKIAAPKVNACLPPLQWQTYDIDFTAAVFEDGKKVQNARITVLLNGVKIHDDVELPGVSAQASPEGGPIVLQQHGTPVRFRNIWVVPK